MPRNVAATFAIITSSFVSIFLVLSIKTKAPTTSLLEIIGTMISTPEAKVSFKSFLVIFTGVCLFSLLK